MSTRRITSINRTAIYFIMIMVIIVAFFLLGGWPWMKGTMHGSSSMGMTNWNWPQILISLGLGFLLGLFVSRRRR